MGLLISAISSLILFKVAMAATSSGSSLGCPSTTRYFPSLLKARFVGGKNGRRQAGNRQQGQDKKATHEANKPQTHREGAFEVRSSCSTHSIPSMTWPRHRSQSHHRLARMKTAEAHGADKSNPHIN
eukprot:759980-Hanusia_phi.AAC.5